MHVQLCTMAAPQPTPLLPQSRITLGSVRPGLTGVGVYQAELACNPFLRCRDPGLAASCGTQPGAPTLAELRRRRDAWGGWGAVGMNWAVWLIQSLPPIARRWGLDR